MGAFWSAQDIADQKASRLFSVLGKITSEQPEILITAGSNQQEVKLSVDTVFDLECEKLHENSDYSVSPEMINNITEYKYVAPVNNWNKSYNAGGYNNANKSTTKPATAVGGNYYGYGNLKSALITKLHTYDTSYSLSSTKTQELCLAFLDFLEDSALSKDVTYATDLAEMDDILNNVSIQFDATFDLILDQFGLKHEEKEADLNPLTTAEKDFEDVDNFALQSYNPNFNS